VHFDQTYKTPGNNLSVRSGANIDWRSKSLPGKRRLRPYAVISDINTFIDILKTADSAGDLAELAEMAAKLRRRLRRRVRKILTLEIPAAPK
jgi:hypothetical protein